MKKVLLFGSGYYDPEFNYLESSNYDKDTDYIVGVDGGINYLAQKNIKPDLIIGDLDSSNNEAREIYRDVETIKHPVKKNETDSELAIRYFKEKGLNKFILIGMLGDRIDHSLANIFLLEKLTRDGLDVEIIGSKNHLIGIKGPKNLKTYFPVGKTVSFISLSKKVKNLTLKGFEYPLKKFTLRHDEPGRAVSNITAKKNQNIKFKKGILLIDLVIE